MISMSYRDPAPVHPLVVAQGAKVIAFDARTGRRVWEHRLRSSVQRFALAHDRVYVIDHFCGLTCIDAMTGVQLGSFPAGDPDWTPCALLAGPELLYVLMTGGIAAVDPGGKIVWQSELEGSGGTRGGIGLPGDVMQPDFAG
jgi:outer membrane protein assembly factor BamB